MCSFHFEIPFYKLREIIKKSTNEGVERGVATRMAQMVWPMMTVTVTNFEGFTGQQFWQECAFSLIFVRKDMAY